MQSDAFQSHLTSREQFLIHSGRIPEVIHAHRVWAETVKMNPVTKLFPASERDRLAAKSTNVADQLEYALKFEESLPW